MAENVTTKGATGKPRALWKGVLKLGELTCPVALYTAASTSERIAFHTLNRKTGHRLRRQFIDAESGEEVPGDEQIKGYDTGGGDFLNFDPEEIASAIPESDKTLDIQAFVACDAIDPLHFDRPYYLAPSSPAARDTYAVLGRAMASKKVAAVARAVLFRRLRSVLVRADGEGLAATTLKFDYEVRSDKAAFADIPEVKIEGEMLDLAQYIIKSKMGTFDPSSFHDRYEQALAELVKAKMEGRTIKPPEKRASAKVVDLREALRQSARALGQTAAKRTRKAG